MMRLFFLAIFLTGILQNALAYPIPPRPLRKLVSESKYIIVGYVVKICQKQEKDEKKKKKKQSVSYQEPFVARIAVRERLQGGVIPDTIELSYNPYMACPAPPTYEEHTHVLCFLNDDEDGHLYTPALSYGAKTMPEEDIGIYKKRIYEIQQIATYTDVRQRATETVEWLVKCAEQRATRWEGTYELKPQSDFMSFYDRDSLPDLEPLLNAGQKQRLAQALFKETKLSYHDFALADLVYKDNERQIDALLISNLKALEKDEYWNAASYFERLRYRSPTADMRRLMERFEEIRFGQGKSGELQSIIQEFIRLIE